MTMRECDDAWVPPRLVPEWPQIAGVCFHTTRRRVSRHRLAARPGDHVRDDPAAVAANRHILTEAIQRSSPGARPAFLQQGMAAM
jgi:copper oxidase (laccase) domain-containing protein